MLTVSLILIFLSLGFALGAAGNFTPLWPSPFLLAILELLRLAPLG